MNALDPDACYRALLTRDARFDGRFFTGVTSTGVYCRPICPARTPKRENCTFHPSAAAAEAAGFRSCLRCRPEASPELAVWRGTSNTVSRALALIAEGALDGDDADVERLAERLGVGERQLRRLFRQHLGASPVAVAQTRRVLFAKALIADTDLGMAEVALASGFGSVRRFNHAFQTLYGRPPGTLRRRQARAAAGGGVTLFIPWRAPYDWPAMLAFEIARAVPGVETVEGGRYRRTFVHGGAAGTVEIKTARGREGLAVTVRHPQLSALQAAAGAVRRVFDVAADVGAIGEHLSADPALAPLVAARPGLRVPGGWEPFELSVRAVLGQQVTLGAARKLAGELTRRYGAASPAGDAALTHTFPDAATLAEADLSGMPMPGSRGRTIVALARASLADPDLFRPAATLEASVRKLLAVPGVGDWTAQYIAMRAMRDPDAFPASDVGLLRAPPVAEGGRPSPAELLKRAEPWRPWRAYAAQHLWSADADRINQQKEIAA